MVFYDFTDIYKSLDTRFERNTSYFGVAAFICFPTYANHLAGCFSLKHLEGAVFVPVNGVGTQFGDAGGCAPQEGREREREPASPLRCHICAIVCSRAGDPIERCKLACFGLRRVSPSARFDPNVRLSSNSVRHVRQVSRSFPVSKDSIEDGPKIRQAKSGRT